MPNRSTLNTVKTHVLTTAARDNRFNPVNKRRAREKAAPPIWANPKLNLAISHRRELASVGFC
jgi:hypothetical protein